MKTNKLFVFILMLLGIIIQANNVCYAQEKAPEFNMDAADIVSEKYILKESEAIILDGAVVYPRPEPIHPMEQFREMEAPGPPDLPYIELETSINDPSLVIPLREDKITTEKQMREALKQLRQEHEKYLRDFTPEKPSSRIRVNLKQFSFRYETEEDKKDINLALTGGGNWEQIDIPHYVGPGGKWGAFYRTELEIPESFWEKECYMLHFNGVDYWSQVYLNGRCVGTHTGGWAPYEIDVTSYLDPGRKNVLVVRVENDWRMRVYGGEKIYAATGPGFDKPVIGWNPTHAGAGLWQKCWLEARPKVHLTDIYVIPDVTNKSAEIHVELNNMSGNRSPLPIDLELDIFCKNFEGKTITGIPVQTEPAGGQSHEYIAILKLDEIREWTPEHPWLYTVRARVAPKPGQAEVFDPGPGAATVDSEAEGEADYFDAHFGMRTFAMDLSSKPKGRMYLNGEPVILRGSDDMSAFFQDVIREDTEQLIEDILIFKLANLNFIRLCQSPRQPEAYEMFDRLGIMVQTDLPIFGEVRRPLVPEATKQAMEMEKLVRCHPSNILVSLINEPSNLYGREMGHRHLLRPDLHRFFEAAIAGIGIQNPDRIVKPIDGDYNPPSPGFPDDHLYTMWYLDHGVPIGKLVKGYWKANKPGWYGGSGEWGGSSLQNAECLFKFYPEEYLPEGNRLDVPWDPKKLGNFSQIQTRGYAWFDKQETLGEYIAVSQEHQVKTIDWVQRAFRRQSNRIISTAQFFLIEGWPNNCIGCGLVDYMRKPKPAFYTMREACTPLLVDIRTDRLKYYGGEKLAAEFWLANDKKAPFEKGTLVWQLEMNNKQVFTQSCEVTIPSWGPSFVGYFPYKTPAVEKRTILTVKVALLDPDGRNISDYYFDFEIFPRPEPLADLTAGILGDPGERTTRLTSSLGIKTRKFTGKQDPDLLLIDDLEYFEKYKKQVLKYIQSGGHAMVLPQEAGTVFDMDGDTVRVASMAGKHFVSRKTGHPVVADFQANDFAYWYHHENDYMDHVASSYVEGDNLQPIFLTVDFARVPRPLFKEDLSVDAELKYGKGSIIFSQVSGLKRLDHEPVALWYYHNLMKYLAN